MRTLTKVLLIGHVAADPEAITTKHGATRVTFPLATHREATSDGVKKEVTDYHRIVTWEALANVCALHLEKGRAVYVEGQLLNRAYEKDGERKYVTEIRADVVNFLDAKKKGGVETVQLVDVMSGPSDGHREGA